MTFMGLWFIFMGLVFDSRGMIWIGLWFAFLGAIPSGAPDCP